MKIHYFSKFLALSACSLATTVFAQPTKPAKIDTEFPYFRGSGELVSTGSFSGPKIDLGAGIMVNGETELKSGYGLGLALGRQWRSENDKKEFVFHRAEIEFVTTSTPRKSVRILETKSVDDSLRSEALFANYLRRVHESKDYRFWLGAGVGFARTKVPGGPTFSTGCDCPKGGSESGYAYQVKAVAHRQWDKNLLVQAHIAYRSLPGFSSGGAPSTTYDRFYQGTVGIGFEYLFD